MLIKCYTEASFSYTDASEVSFNDFGFLKRLDIYEKNNERIVGMVQKKLLNRLWYFNGEYAAMPLFDERVENRTKKELAIFSKRKMKRKLLMKYERGK